jgi:hypothetical protein
MDINKLTVVKLQQQLKAKGLSTAGLKAVLKARLIEAVATDENSDSDSNESFSIHVHEEEVHNFVTEPPTKGTRGKGMIYEEEEKNYLSLEAANQAIIDEGAWTKGNTKL